MDASDAVPTFWFDVDAGIIEADKRLPVAMTGVKTT